MILWLDHLIFGDGLGLRSPLHDNRFYWLADERTGHREIYTFSGGLGAQLHSIQWRHPKPGEERHLFGRNFVIFNTTRRWGRVYCSWALVGLSSMRLDDTHKCIRELKEKIGEPWHISSS